MWLYRSVAIMVRSCYRGGDEQEKESTYHRDVQKGRISSIYYEKPEQIPESSTNITRKNTGRRGPRRKKISRLKKLSTWFAITTTGP